MFGGDGSRRQGGPRFPAVFIVAVGIQKYLILVLIGRRFANMVSIRPEENQRTRVHRLEKLEICPKKFNKKLKSLIWSPFIADGSPEDGLRGTQAAGLLIAKANLELLKIDRFKVT